MVGWHIIPANKAEKEYLVKHYYPNTIHFLYFMFILSLIHRIDLTTIVMVYLNKNPAGSRREIGEARDPDNSRNR